MLELAKSGRWLGGQTPLGYESKKLSYLDDEFNEKIMHSLSPIKDELQIVKTIYHKYLQYKSISQVFLYLFKNNIKTKNGADFNKKRIQLILRNPLYVKANEDIMKYLSATGMNVIGIANNKHGILTYNKSKGAKVKRDISEWIAAISTHEGIVDAKHWLDVQQILDENKNKVPRLGTSAAALLTGTLKCSKCGKSMIVKHGHISAQTNKKIQYYVCSTKDYSKGVRCNNTNIRVDILELLIIKNLENITIDKASLIRELNKIKFELTKDSYSIYEIPDIPKQIKLKQSQIDILINQLTLDNEISKYLRPKIIKLGNELDILKETNNNLKIISSKDINQQSNINKFFYSLDNLSSVIDVLDFNTKRLLINNIVDSICWDGDNCTIKINFKLKH